MTRSETIKIVYVIKATYPTHFARYTTADFDNLIQAWQAVLEDYTYQQASAGLRIYLASDTKGFPPSPGQVIDCIQKTMAHQELDMNALEAWDLVRHALKNSAYHSEEEFSKLPPVVRRAVGSASNLREMCMLETSEVETVEQSHFVRNYDAMVKRTRDEAKIPSKVRELIAQAAQERLAEKPVNLLEEAT